MQQTSVLCLNSVCTNGTLHCHSWKESRSSKLFVCFLSLYAYHIKYKPFLTRHFPTSATCPYPKVYFNCSTSGTGELGHQCAQTCLNLDIDECVSGLLLLRINTVQNIYSKDVPERFMAAPASRSVLVCHCCTMCCVLVCLSGRC